MSESQPSKTSSTQLPWVLVAVLGVAVVVLALMLVSFNRNNPGTAEPAPAGQEEPQQQQPQQPDEQGQPQQPEGQQQAPSDPGTMDPELKKLLESLPRREADDYTAKGDVDAPVVLIEWADYRCPYCAVWSVDTAPQLQKYVDDGTLRIEFRDLPIFGPDSERAAVAARAAGEQGKFWEFHEALFAEAPRNGHADVSDEDVRRIAEKVGVADMKKFDADRNSDKIKQAVTADATQARSLGIGGTPFFVINYQVINGAQPAENFIKAIEDAKRG
ncbi:DsbA family protein [Enemella sp. A6]|uniref:DsbA family protein n=1 Tax=Enemella sp. A6 TaxID=3440152 RepID=UPI003EBF480C